MVQLYFVLSAVGALTMVATWRLLTRRFPHPGDLIALSIFYYSIPLAAVAIFLPDMGRLVFLHSAAMDRGVSQQSIKFALLALLCLEAGRWVATRIRASHQLQFTLRSTDKDKASVVLGGLLCLVLLGIALYGPASFFAGYNVASEERTAALGNALIYASIELIGLTMGYMFLVCKAFRVRFGSKLVLFTMAFLLFLAIIRGKRLEVISAFLPLGILVFAMHPLFRSALSRALTIAIAAVLISAMASFRLGQPPTFLAVAFNLMTEGVFAGHALPGIIDRLSVGELGYEYGIRIGLALLAFVPRFIWPTKDEIVYAGSDALDGVSPVGATNILAEVLLQGGGAAIVIWYVGLGFVCERVYGAQRVVDRGLQEQKLYGSTLTYLILAATFVPHFRDGLIPSIKMLMQASIFLFALAGWAPSLRINWRAKVARRRSGGIALDSGAFGGNVSA